MFLWRCPDFLKEHFDQIFRHLQPRNGGYVPLISKDDLMRCSDEAPCSSHDKKWFAVHLSFGPSGSISVWLDTIPHHSIFSSSIHHQSSLLLSHETCVYIFFSYMTISVVVHFIFTYIVHTYGISSLQFPSTSWLRYEVAIYSGCVTEPVSLGMEVERL